MNQIIPFRAPGFWADIALTVHLRSCNLKNTKTCEKSKCERISRTTQEPAIPGSGTGEQTVNARCCCFATSIVVLVKRI